MKRSLSILASVAGIFLLSGCATSSKISNELNPEFDFTTLHSFALMPLPTNIPGADPGTILRYGKTAQEGLKAALESKGYREVDANEADFAVNLKATIVPKIEVTDWGFDYGHYGRRGYWGARYPYGSMGGNVDVDSYKEGTLIIEIFDTKSKELAWVSWATGRKKSKPMEHEELKTLIGEILESFPQK